MESKVLIATRKKGFGDTWNLIDIEDKIMEQTYKSLTDALEAYYQFTNNRCDFILSPMKGELYALLEDNTKPVPKKFDLYDER